MSLVVFFFAAVGAIGFAGGVVLQSNPFVSALCLLGNLASLATLYLLLQADFVGAAQVIVYAGAVMVMFLFVIAYVGPRGELDDGPRVAWKIWAAVIAGVAILVEIIIAVGRSTLDTPADVSGDYGSPAEIGKLLLTDYLFDFEAVSILLLIAAVVAVVLGAGPRPKRVAGRDEKARREQIRDVRTARRAASAALIASAREEQP